MSELARTELTDFLRFCRSERRLAPMTCSAYERDVSACLGYLQGEGIEELAEVKVTHLRAFLAERAEHAPGRLEPGAHDAALKLLLPLPRRGGAALRDPALPLRTPKKREVLPDVLTRASSSGCSPRPSATTSGSATSPASRERDRLLLALFAYAGLRRSELLGLDWDDVDLERRLLRIRKAKGGRQRTIPIHPALEPLFVDYYAIRASRSRAGPLRRRPGQAAPRHPARPDLPPLRRGGRRQRAQARHPAHAPARLRHRAAPRRREPAPDPGAARAQAPRLDPALHARERPRAARRDQAAPLGRLRGWRAWKGRRERYVDAGATIGLRRATDPSRSTSTSSPTRTPQPSLPRCARFRTWDFRRRVTLPATYTRTGPTATTRAFRVLFATEGRRGQVLLSLEGFSKKTQKTPSAKIRLAERRLADWRRRARMRS